jgi:hypothetical protein
MTVPDSIIKLECVFYLHSLKSVTTMVIVTSPVFIGWKDNIIRKYDSCASNKY